MKLRSVAGVVGKTRKRKVAFHPDPVGRGGAQFAFREPLVVELTLTGQSGGALVRMDARGQARAACDRCLKDVDVPVETSGYVQVQAEPAGDDDEALAMTPGDEVDLGPALDEVLLLALPMKVLCRPGCLGLCASCGQDLNEHDCGCPAPAPDPRLAALERFRGSGEEERK